MPNLPGRVGDVGGYLREQREHAKLSVRQLAALAGVSNPYLSQIERGLRKPSAEVLQQLAKGLRISAEALYLRAGILDAETMDGARDPDVHLALHAESRLSERQRRVLLDLYSTFLEENGHTEENRPGGPEGPEGQRGRQAAAPAASVAPTAPTAAPATRAARPLRAVPTPQSVPGEGLEATVTRSLPEPPA